MTDTAKMFLTVSANADSFKQSTTIVGSASSAHVALRGIDLTASATPQGWEFTLTGTDRGNEASEQVSCKVTATYKPASGAGYDRTATATVTPGEKVAMTASFRSN